MKMTSPPPILVLVLIVYSILLSLSYCIAAREPDAAKSALLMGGQPHYPDINQLPGIGKTLTQREKDAVDEMFSQIDEQGILKTREEWVKSTQTALTMMKFLPMDASQRDDYVLRSLRGESPPRPELDVAAVVAREKENGETFAGALIADLPDLSTEDLIQTRIRLTAGLAMNQMVAQNNDEALGIPLDVFKNNILILAKCRDAVNAELEKRGVDIE